MAIKEKIRVRLKSYDHTLIDTAAEKIVHTKKAYVPTGDDYTEAFKRYCELDEKLNG